MNPLQRPVKPRILVAPLDWGLGHATRCIPVIRSLLACGADVWLAGEGTGEQLLKTEFPGLPFLPLRGYRMHYGKTAWGTAIALLRQLPKLRRAIKQEELWLHSIVTTHKFDAVISDNRYGLHHPALYSVFITHQLQIKTPTRRTNKLLQKWAYRQIRKFNACWVPDNEGPVNFAGALAHPTHLPAVPVTYLGLLSRFHIAAPVLTHYLLILLSGPEPQRTLLEKRLLQQAQLFQTPIWVVRGLPGTAGLPAVPYHVTITNHLPAGVLQKAIAGAQFVISRCGYSTVMDLMTLQKKCIFIPTPVQTEQVYLAQYLMKTKRALCLPQRRFHLKTAVDAAATFPYQFPEIEKTDALQKAVVQLLQQL